jgi:hypothetical protein
MREKRIYAKKHITGGGGNRLQTCVFWQKTTFLFMVMGLPDDCVTVNRNLQNITILRENFFWRKTGVGYNNWKMNVVVEPCFGPSSRTNLMFASTQNILDLIASHTCGKLLRNFSALCTSPARMENSAFPCDLAGLT